MKKEYLLKIFLVILLLTINPKIIKSLINRVPSYPKMIIDGKHKISYYVLEGASEGAIPSNIINLALQFKKTNFTSYKLSIELFEKAFQAPRIMDAMLPRIVDQNSNIVISSAEAHYSNCEEIFKNEEYKIVNCN